MPTEPAPLIRSAHIKSKKSLVLGRLLGLCLCGTLSLLGNSLGALLTTSSLNHDTLLYT